MPAFGGARAARPQGPALVATGQPAEAKASFEAASTHQEAAKDWRGLCASLDQLADLAEKGGDKDGARKLLERAMETAGQADLREERKALKKKHDALV